MKIFTKFFLSGIKLIRDHYLYADPGKYVMLLLALASLTFGASAQSITWTDNFMQGQAPTTSQCNNWTNFLDQLGHNDFLSVKISGTFDATGIKITDPAAATQLAGFLNSRTEGTVVSGGHTWSVTVGCNSGSCVPSGVELVVDGAGCDCTDKYAIRPHVGNTNPNWGGVNTATCTGISQAMKVEFETGAAITSSGSTSFCEGGSVVLKAGTEKCSPPYTYLWSNGETTESITVTSSGNFSVTVSGANGCRGISTAVLVTVNHTTVDAGEDVAICDNSVQLHAVGKSNGAPTPPVVTKFCLFDAPGGTDNCTFTNSLCDDGLQYISNSQFSQSTTVTNPIELRFQLFYSPCTDVATFTFKLNGNEIGSFVENKETCACTSSAAGQYPRTITFAKSQFHQFWSDTDANVLTVNIVADSQDLGVALSGITSEVVSQGEFYSWLPATGLSDASIANPVANPTVSTTYTVTYTSVDGCSATDQILVKGGCNTPPIAVCKPVSIATGNNCEGNAKAVDFNGGSTDEDGDELTYTIFPAGPYAIGKTEVMLTVTDSKGESNSCRTTITVTDKVLPTIVTPEDLSRSNDPGLCSATLTLTEPETADNCQVKSVSHDQTDNIFPEGETIVTWTVTDIHGNSNSTTQKIIVTNVEPVIHSVTGSRSVVSVNTSLSLTASYTDNNVVSATIDWDDHSRQTVTNPESIFKVSHWYKESGFYSITLTLTDACGATAMYVYENIVVYDPNGGFVTGGGWFFSPAGAYIKKPSVTGKATFSFDSKYKKKGSAPEGNTEFEFNAGNLKFKSKEYEWLVVDGNTAVFKGSGKVNGNSGYGILISVVDDDNKDGDHDNNNDHDKKWSKKSKKSDRIRVKIWDKSGLVVYDTQIGSPDNAEATTKIGGGSIQIHDGKSKHSSDSFENSSANADNAREASTAVYPNPFKESITVQFYSSSKENLNLQLLDITGKIIYDRNHPFSEDGSYSLQLPNDEGGSGLYILKLNQGRRVEFLRLVRK